MNLLLEHEQILIPLWDKNGEIAGHAIVDPDDFEWLSKIRFHRCKKKAGRFYAKCSDPEKIVRQVYLHQLVMRRSGHHLTGNMVDHRNGDTLDNRKENIRITDDTGNARNKTKHWTTEGEKCVRRDRRTKNKNRFLAYICVEYKQINIGTFDTEREAAIAYDIKAREYFGEFAKPNILDATNEEIEQVRTLLRNPKKLPGTSRYRGVVVGQRSGWKAQISINNVTKNMGTYPTELEAAKAYNAAAIKYHGNKAKLNIIPL